MDRAGQEVGEPGGGRESKYNRLVNSEGGGLESEGVHFVHFF